MMNSPLASEHQHRHKEQEVESEAPQKDNTVTSPSALGENEPGSVVQREDDEAVAFAVRGFKLYAILVGVCFGAFMMSLDVFIVSTAIPAITSDFHDTSQLAWYPAAYSLTTCVLTPLTGRLTASFPLRWVYIVSFCIFLVGSVVCGWAPTSNAFIIGRAVAGVGAAGVATGGMTVVLTVASPRTKPVFMGLCSGCFALGIVLAPILSGVFTTKATWRWCFWFNLPPGAVTLATMLFFFRPPPRSPRDDREKLGIGERIKSLDLIGCGIFIPAIFMLLLALTRGNVEQAWGSATVVGLFVGGGVLLLVFVFWERRKGDEAMIPGRLLQRRAISCSVLFSFCHLGSVAVMSYYLPEWFQAVQGLSALESGVRTVTTAGSQIFSTLFAGALAYRIKFYNPWLFTGPIFMATAAALYSQFSAVGTPARHYIGYQVLQGLGVGMAQQMPSLIAQLAVRGRGREELLPVVVALNLFAQYLGATVAQVVGGVVFHSVLANELTNIGLSPAQRALLSAGGTADIRRVVDQHFPPGLLRPVLEAYNTAITSTFYVPCATTAVAFVLAFGVEWIRVPAASDQTKAAAAKDET